MWQRMKKTEAYRYDDGLFHVTEIFDSIDGEGKRTGLMAIFVRLAGCNLRCSYCDTAYSLSLTDTAEALTEEELLSRIHAFPWKKITLTGGEPDVDYIMAIMEVMKQRDANPPAAEADVDAAWRDFKENYQGQASAYETEVLPERDSSHLDQITSPSPKKKSRRILRAAVITAACIVILCGAASAFGFDLLQAFADWTAETFGFVTPGQEEAEAPQPASRPTNKTIPNSCSIFFFIKTPPFSIRQLYVIIELLLSVF